MEEQDYIRIKTDDFTRIVIERDRLRVQVTELQELCTKQCLALRALRAEIPTP